MAGVPAGLPVGVRVSDHTSLGVMARTFPPDRVQQVLAETGKASERDLPAQVMVHSAIAMALCMGSTASARCCAACWRACAGSGEPMRSRWRARAASRRRAAAWTWPTRRGRAYLSVVYPSEKDRRHATHGTQVRVVEYRLEDVADAEPPYRLVTTILDPAMAPAADLAALYHERWEIEGALAELRTHRRGTQVVLRSKIPDLAPIALRFRWVRQEFRGLLLAHFAMRGLMHEASLRTDEDPDRLSFLHAVCVVCRKLPLLAAFPALGTGSLCMRTCWTRSWRSAWRSPKAGRSRAGSSAR